MSEIAVGGLWGGGSGAEGDRIRRAVDKLLAPSRARGVETMASPRTPSEEVAMAERAMQNDTASASRRILQLEAMLLFRLSRLEQLLAGALSGASSSGAGLGLPDFERRRPRRSLGQRYRDWRARRAAARTGPWGQRPSRLQRLGGYARDMATGAVEHGRNLWGSAKAGAGRLLTGAGTLARGVGSSALEAGRGILGAGSRAAMGVGRGALALGSRALGPLGLALGLYGSATDPSTSTLGTMGEYGLNAWSGASTGAMIGSVVPGVGTAIGGAVGAGVGIAATYLARNWDQVKNVWGDLATRTKGLASDIASGVTGLLGSAKDRIVAFSNSVADAAQGGFDWIKRRYDELSSTVSETINNLDIPEKFLSIRNLIRSLMTRAGNLLKSAAGAISNPGQMPDVSGGYDALGNPLGGAAPPPAAPHNGSNPPIAPRASGSAPRGAPTRPGAQSSSAATAGPIGDTTPGTGNLSGLQTNGRVGTRGLTGDVTDAAKRLQDHHGSIVVTGGTEGGHSANGYHPEGQAVDVRINGMSQADRERLVENARRAGFTGIGLASDHLHLDRRPGAPVVFFEKGGRQVWGGDKGYWNDRLGKIQPSEPGKAAAPAEASAPVAPPSAPTPPTLSERTIKGYTGMPSAPKAPGAVDPADAPALNQKPAPEQPRQQDAPALPGSAPVVPAGMGPTADASEDLFLMDSGGLRLYKTSELA